MYDVPWAGFYVCMFVGVSPYVDLHKDLEVGDVYEAGFCVVYCTFAYKI